MHRAREGQVFYSPRGRRISRRTRAALRPPLNKRGAKWLMKTRSFLIAASDSSAIDDAGAPRRPEKSTVLTAYLLIRDINWK